ncbi:MAG: amidohydrolase family protein, partial [Gemmatimonadota bacterium]|nr:amidohydrolase family protein [Gemmatimonadota bacterium]
MRFAGATLAPALVDHHAHLFNIGVTLLNDRDHGRLFLDLGDARSLADVAARVRARAAMLAPGAWILGAGWSQAAWGAGALPSRFSLDAAAPDNPVYLARGDGHAGWVNARALARAGIDRNTANPTGGAILRRADGSPSGILLERANELVAPLVPAPADSDIVAAWRLGAEALAERGVARVYDAGVLPLPGVVALNAPFAHYYDLLRRADSVAPLPIAVNLMVPAPSALADSLLADPQRGRAVSPRIHVTHLKLFADGALGSRGAALTHPYADDRTTSGVPRMTTAEIAALAGAALDAGLGVATHAIGDEAVRRTLDAYAEVLRARPGVAPGRLRIEHFSYAREQDFARAVKMGVVFSIQGNFNAGPDEHPTLGEARAGAANDARVYAWRRLVGMGARIAEGSDYFTRPAGALAGFMAAIERRHAAAEGLPPAAARRLAYRLASTWYGPSGTAEPPDLRNGESANVVVLSANPLTAPLGEVGATAVLATVCAGRLTFAR